MNASSSHFRRPFTRALAAYLFLPLAACLGGGISPTQAPGKLSGQNTGQASGETPSATTETQLMAAAIDNNVNFANWGINGGFSAMPLTALLAKHPQLQDAQQLFVTAGAQALLPIPPQLLVAICLEESSGGLNVGSKGGPFQFTDDGAWAAYGPKGGNRDDMGDAAKGAANYIADLLLNNGSDLNAALRSYNGPIADGGNAKYQAEIQQWMQGVAVYGNGV